MKSFLVSLLSSLPNKVTVTAAVLFSVVTSGTAGYKIFSQLQTTPPPAPEQAIMQMQADQEVAANLDDNAAFFADAGFAAASSETFASAGAFPVVNSSTNNGRCIVTLAGNKYDVTTLRSSHSGGDVFKCGTDMTALYKSQHGTNLSRMQRYLVTASGNSNQANSNGNNNTNVNNLPVFDLAALTLHNRPGDCFIAYNGNVYDVSSHPSWLSCTHHGATGGMDITSRFPHAVSYFNSLPLIGTMQNGSNNGSGNPPVANSEQAKKQAEWEREQAKKEEERRREEAKQKQEEQDEEDEGD